MQSAMGNARLVHLLSRLQPVTQLLIACSYVKACPDDRSQLGLASPSQNAANGDPIRLVDYMR
jgi:hypothetical protein